MKRSDIKVGVPYQWQAGQHKDLGGHNDHIKVIVLDTEPRYEPVGRFWLSRFELLTTREDAEIPKVRFTWRGDKSARMLAAAETLVYRPVTINPETGQPWTPDEVGDHLRYQCMKAEPGTFEKPVQIGTTWWPVAVQARDIVRPWAEHEADRQRQKVVAEMSRLAYEEQRERQRQENLVRQEEERKKAEQRNKENAIRKEFYEERLEPALIEALGEAPVDVSWHHANGRVALSFDQLQRLLDGKAI